MLTPELLELIRCPQCKGKLEFHEAEQFLRCAACRRRYPIKDGIPVLLVGQSQVEG